jgi:hypothetical protein
VLKPPQRPIKTNILTLGLIDLEIERAVRNNPTIKHENILDSNVLKGNCPL